MKEDFLKILWQSETNIPEIDFAAAEKNAAEVQNKLRRRVKIEIALQIAATAVTIIPVFFHPRMILLTLVTIALCLWYVPELRKLYRTESPETAKLPIKDALVLKIETMKNFFRRTRFVMYFVVPFFYPLMQYSLGQFDDTDKSVWVFVLIAFVTLVVSELIMIWLTERYFKVLYKPILADWENMLEQLDAND